MLRLGVAFAIVASASSAMAHGRFPESQQLLTHPTDPNVLAVATTFGLVVSRDRGDSWRWVCRTATHASTTEDPVFQFASDGAIVAGVFDGLVRSVEPCRWDLLSGPLADRVVFDITRHPSLAATLYALTSDGGGTPNLLFRSDDDGRTWTPTSDPIESILFERVRIAPSQPERIYLSGAYPRTADLPRRPFVHRSSDGGATWESFAFAFREGEKNLRLLAVDPSDANIVYMRVVKEAGADTERLVRSVDAGETWETLLDVVDLTSLVINPEGTVWVGGRNPGTPASVFDGGVGLDGGAPMEGRHGLWRSVDGESFELIRAELSIGCLAWREGELWACAANYQDGFALGRSGDEGATFEPVLRFQEMLGPVECAASDPTLLACQMSPGDMDIRVDLSVEGPATGSGCGCQPTHGTAPTATLLAVVWLLWERRHARV